MNASTAERGFKMAERKPAISNLVIFGGPEEEEQIPGVIAKVLKVENPEDDRGECQLCVLHPERGISFVHAYYSVEPQVGHWSWPRSPIN